MTRTPYPGAWYADATPSGAYVVFTPSVGFQTSAGPVALPPGEPWGAGYVRCTDVGGLRFAGQAHSTIEPACWEWTGLGWFSFPQPCAGVSPCLYDLSGNLLRSDGSVGSQGYRYAWPNGTPSGEIVSGDATYGPWHDLSQYSQAGDSLWIGQAMQDGGGVLVWDGSVLRQLEAGVTTFIRVQVEGEQVAVAFNNNVGCVIYQLTQAELLALPVYTPPSPEPKPVPTPQPKPEPIPMPSAPNVLAQIRAVFAAHPEINTREDGTRGRMTDYVVLALGGVPWGRKDRDQNPSNDNNSDDALCYRLADGRFEIYDIINGGDGSPTFDYAGAFRDGENGYFREVPGTQPPPKPAPVPTPAPAPSPAPAPPAPVPPPKPAGPSYDDTIALVLAMTSAYRGAQNRKERDKRDLDPGTLGHLVWRFLMEGYTAADLIEDARSRGKG